MTQPPGEQRQRQRRALPLQFLMFVATALAAASLCRVTAPDMSTPRWDPQHPDLNPGPRPLTELGSAPASSAAVASPMFDLHVGRSAVAKGVGLLVRGNVPRGTVLLQSAFRVGRPKDRDNTALLDFRAMASINHCWAPNARLLRRYVHRCVFSAQPSSVLFYVEF